MKKRRVLALLLALSLAVSMNGLTVLAAGTDGAETAAIVQEEQTAESAQEDAEGETQETLGETEDTTDTGEADSEEQEDTKPDSGDDSQADADQDDTEGTEEKPGEDSENGDDALEDGKTEETDGEAEPDTEELPSEETDGTDEAEETDEENAEQKTEEAETEKLPAVVRMVTFTDDTGMRITYDANEAASYQYEVSTDGVLTGVKDAEGNAVSFSGEVVLSQPESGSYTGIAASVFGGNTDITYVKIPSGVTSIGDGVFKGCTKLKGVYIPATVTSIGESAFEGCSSLTQLAIPKNMKSIGKNAFYGDARLFMVHMKDADYARLETIGDSAFYGCRALEKFCSDGAFVLPESLVSIGSSAFYGCNSIPGVLMQDNVTEIGSEAFKNCSGVTKVYISSLTGTLPEGVFENCTSISSVEIGNMKNVNLTIEAGAFKGCYNLGSIDLPERVVAVKNGAFESCSNLMRIYIGKQWAEIEDGAFPENEGLCLVGTAASCAAYDYVYKYNHYPTLRFVNINDAGAEELYTYSERLTGDGISEIKMTVSESLAGKDINETTPKGVKARTKLYIVFNGSPLKEGIVELVEGSLKCNGTVIEKAKDGTYSFSMPDGGAVITAEFAAKSSDQAINGLAGNVTTELSNGRELKIGQKTRLFLVSDHDKDDNLIPASKIKYWVEEDDKTYASVASDGTIRALAEGSAVVYASVTGGDGKEILKSVTITITEESVQYIRIRASGYSANVTVDEEESVAYIDSTLVNQNYTFKLKATAYDAYDDDMATAFTWSTSDKKVASLARTSTTSASSENTVTIPKGTDGEATITVTATNKDKTKVTQRFLISVRDSKPRLVSSTITVNPNKTEGGVLEVIGAYDKAVTNVELYEEKNAIASSDFTLTKDTEGSTDTISRYYVKARSGLKDKTYTVRVRINKSNNNMQTLKITVKSSMPNPKVAFQKKQPKINLFMANDQTEIKMLISNLGSEKVSACSLEPLTSAGASTYADDRKFVDNFAAELGEDGNTVVIRQISDSMEYTSKKKPAVTGYLVLKFEGYDSRKVEKKFKITIPTQTVKPAYVLDRTSDTYNEDCESQTVTLKLLDKKTKKQEVLAADEFDEVAVLSSSVSCVSDCRINDDGELEFIIDGSSIKKGDVNIRLHKREWADDQRLTFKYTIKTTTASPKITVKASTVTLNNNYADTPAAFAFVSNQKDTVLHDTQEFIPNSNAKNAAEYEKIHIDCDAQGGTVRIDEDIKPGSYKFTCAVQDQNENTLKNGKVTLTVKVVNTKPTVTMKGSMALNIKAKAQETAEIAITPKNLPEDYVLDVDSTLASIVCTTKNQAAVRDKLVWNIESPEEEDGPDKLTVSLQPSTPSAANYKFSITPCYKSADGKNTVQAKAANFNVKVYTSTISVNLSSKGRLNLLDRLTGEDKEYTTTNSITYTPALKNVKDTVVEARIFDADAGQPKYDSEESKRFTVEVLDGKLYVVPRTGAVLTNNKSYEVKIWVKLENYSFGGSNGGGTWVNDGKILKIKTGQTLPKVTTNVSALNLYLSNKNYTATFIVSPKEGSVGTVSGISFDEKDEKALDSFTMVKEIQKDGSLKVTMKLKNTVSYSCNTTNKIKMYIEFEGQGDNTPGTAITMNVKINK